MITLPASTHLSLGRSLRALVIVALSGAGAATAQTGLVTAVRDGDGNLLLISWSDGGIRLNGPGASAGAVDLISAVRIGDSERMVTAVRDGDGNLLLIPWRVASNGQITRLSQAPGAVNQAGSVSRISAVANRTGDRVLTAVRDGNGQLKVIPWQVSASGSVNRLQGEVTGGAVNDRVGRVRLKHVISATFVDSTTILLATAIRGGTGNLLINTWRLAPNGRLARLGTTSAGAITEVSAVGLGENRLVTAVRDGDGNLLLIAWNVDANGNVVRGEQARAGAASQITAFPIGGNRLATAVRDGDNNLKVIAWEVSPTTGAILRRGDGSAGAVSVISGSVCGDQVPPGTVEFQSSVRNGDGDLQVVKWRMLLNGETITRFPAGESAAGAVSLISTACFR